MNADRRAGDRADVDRPRHDRVSGYVAGIIADGGDMGLRQSERQYRWGLPFAASGSIHPIAPSCFSPCKSPHFRARPRSPTVRASRVTMTGPTFTTIGVAILDNAAMAREKARVRRA